MIRTTELPRTLRVGAAATGVAGILLLAGCAGATDAGSGPAEAEETTSTTQTPAAGDETGSTGSADAAIGDSVYADGTYTADGAYATPESVEEISVTLTLEDDVITDVEVTGDPQARESEQYQGQFIGGIADVVVGQSIDEIAVSRVAGSSLTSGGFNDAVDQIKADAAV